MKSLLEIADDHQLLINNKLRNNISQMEPYLFCVEGGKELLQGIVKHNFEKITHDLLHELMLDYDEEESATLVGAFNYWVHLLNEVSFFKKSINNLSIYVPIERNLLRYLQPVTIDYYEALKRFTQNIDKYESVCMGAFIMSLALEAGLLPSKRNLPLFQRLANPLSEVDGFFYIDAVRYVGTASSTRRVILDPLSIAIHQRFFYPLRQFILKHPEDKLLRALTTSLKNAITTLSETPNISQTKINADFQSHLIIRVPGFLFGRVTDQLENSDVQGAQLERIFGLSDGMLDDEIVEAEQESDNDEYFEAERFVKTSFISISEFNGFIEWLIKNPFVTDHEKIAIEYICHFAFYTGLRRNEAFYLSTEHLIEGFYESVIRVRADELHTLKSLSASRNLLLSWLPISMQKKVMTALEKNELNHVTPIVTILSGIAIPDPIYTKANLLLRQFFNDSAMTLHGLRHSFATRSLFRLMAGSLRLNETYLPAFLEEDLKDSSSFLKSLKVSDHPSQSFLWLLSKVMGHADPRITVQTYLHNLDFMTFFAFNAYRPAGYASRVNEVLGISTKEAFRAQRKIHHQFELYTFSVGGAYKSPINALLKNKNHYLSLVKQPIGNFRSADWFRLCSAFYAFKKIVDSRSDDMPVLVCKMANKVYGYDFLKGLLSAFQFYSFDQFSKSDALLLLSNFHEKHGFFSLPGETDYERLFRKIIACRFNVLVKDTSKSGVLGSYVPCKRPSSYRATNSKLLIKITHTPARVPIKNQHLLFLLCLKLAL